MRELENTIERAVTLCDGDAIAPADLPQEVQVASRTESLRDEVRAGRVDLDSAVGRFESDLIARRWSAARATRRARPNSSGVTRRVLKLKMDRYGIGAAAERRRVATRVGVIAAAGSGARERTSSNDAFHRNNGRKSLCAQGVARLQRAARVPDGTIRSEHCALRRIAASPFHSDDFESTPCR